MYNYEFDCNPQKGPYPSMYLHNGKNLSFALKLFTFISISFRPTDWLTASSIMIKKPEDPMLAVIIGRHMNDCV